MNGDEVDNRTQNDYQMILAVIMDFIRVASLHKGKVLFVEENAV